MTFYMFDRPLLEPRNLHFLMCFQFTSLLFLSLWIYISLSIHKLSVTTVKTFDLTSLGMLEQLPQDMSCLRIDFTFSCLAELRGMQNTSAAFVHIAALLLTVQIKQKMPFLPPAS